MCGIVGYIGPQQAAPVLLDGLKRLEYRGYDSAGVAILDAQQNVHVCRAKGKLVNLEQRLEENRMEGSIGIGHTRWATHGVPSEENAHPHRSDTVVVVHNGIIENYLDIKHELESTGIVFNSDTDTEVIPHLIDSLKKQHGDLESALREALNRLDGSFSVVVASSQDPSVLYAAKKRSPLILGLGSGENFIASDIPAILSHTQEVIILEDGDLARVTADDYTISDLHTGQPIDRKVQEIHWSPGMAEKEGYKHFMLKEIHEQPRAVSQTLQGRLFPDKGEVWLGDECVIDNALLTSIKRIVFVACGTSWHAALYGKYLIENLVRLPVEVDLASEFRYRQPIVDESTLIIAISQSGETADTLAAIEEGRQRKAKVLSICNVIGSSIPRASDYCFYTHAGPEIGVASTKAFTTQLVALYLTAMSMALQRGGMERPTASNLMTDLLALPHLLEETLHMEDSVLNLAQRFFQYSDFLYLGRGLSYPVALEGALKLKEISYIHAEGYPGGEIKHGPIALIDESMPVLVIASNDATLDKVLANLSEVKTRGAITILCVSEEQQEHVKKRPDIDHLMVVPSANQYLLPIIQTVPLQLLAYHIAVLRGTDVDQPRNLAKSVTVE